MSTLSRACLRFSSKLLVANKASNSLAQSVSPAVASYLNSSSPSAAARRWYRGDADEPETTLSAEEEALLKIAQPKADEIFKDHIALSTDDLATRQKRLVYRAKQRGWLEVDLLLGTWAHENVPHLNSDELDQFEDFVNMETIDIYNVITLRLDVPEEMKTADGSGIAEKIQAWARQSPLGQADPAKYKEVKTNAKLT